MTGMLTAKEMQTLLQVDRSTIYRMAEAGQLPGIKVGKQWRFPNDRVESWLRTQVGTPAPPANPESSGNSLAAMLPLDCVQLIQDAFAEALGVMFIVTDLAGQAITQASNPCPVYNLLVETEHGPALLREKWRELGQIPALEPRFAPCLGEILCARALVRLGNELKGMVIACGVAPQNWPPPAPAVAGLAHTFQIAPDKLQSAFVSVARLSQAEQKKVLLTTQRIADILAHITTERYSLLERLETISKLSAL
jgi:excisionase family DNA binding protein